MQVASEIVPRDTDEIVDATGLILLLGAIDPQVRESEPGLEHKEDLLTASLACAKGDVTSFLEMPNTKPLTTTQAALDDKLQRAASKCLVNYGFFMGATAENLPDLLLNTDADEEIGSFAQMNSLLRSPENNKVF